MFGVQFLILYIFFAYQFDLEFTRFETLIQFNCNIDVQIYYNKNVRGLDIKTCIGDTGLLHVKEYILIQTTSFVDSQNYKFSKEIMMQFVLYIIMHLSQIITTVFFQEHRKLFILTKKLFLDICYSLQGYLSFYRHNNENAILHLIAHIYCQNYSCFIIE